MPGCAPKDLKILRFINSGIFRKEKVSFDLNLLITEVSHLFINNRIIGF